MLHAHLAYKDELTLEDVAALKADLERWFDWPEKVPETLRMNTQIGPVEWVRDGDVWRRCRDDS